MGLLDNRRRYGKNKPDYSTKYLTFTALESGTFTLTITRNVSTSLLTSISYSTNNGASWTTTNNSSSQVVITTPTIAAGKTVLWRGVGTKMSGSSSYTNRSNFSSTGRFTVSGNPLSLLYNTSFSSVKSISATYALCAIFTGCNKLEDASNLSLPATSLSSNCYDNMFTQCTSLTKAPELPATTLAQYCYNQMFYGCTSLTKAPELRATTLVAYCYNGMFRGCTSLTKAPELRATTLVSNCYSNMFNGCTSLNYIKALCRVNVSSSYINNWTNGVASSGTFVKYPNVSYETGANGIPSGWTVQTATS